MSSVNIHILDLALYDLRSYYNILKNPRSQMSKSLVLTMTPQLGLTSQNPSAYYWRPIFDFRLIGTNSNLELFLDS